MSDTTELNWEEYEAITKYIYEALGAGQGVKIKGYGRNCKVNGRSGVEHQVDVLTEQSDGDRKLLTAIECKYAKKKVTKQVVMTLSKIMEDSDIACGIIVCKAGFTKDTMRFAEHEGIKLVKLWEAGEADEHYNQTFEIGTADLNFNIQRTRPKVIRVDFGDHPIENEDQIMQINYAHLNDSNGNRIAFGKFIAAFSERLQAGQCPDKITTIDFPLTRKLFYKSPEGLIASEKISITGHLTESDLSFKRSLVITDRVWMIMNELFDKRQLTLSKSGLIWNLPPKV